MCVWAQITESSGVRPFHLGLGLGVQQGHPNSLHLPFLLVLLSLTLASLQTGLLPGCLPAASGKHFLSAFPRKRKKAPLSHRNWRVDLSLPLFTLEPISQAKRGGFLLGHKPVCKAAGWSGTGFSHLVVGERGFPGGKWGYCDGGSVGRHTCDAHRGMGWRKDRTLAFAL